LREARLTILRPAVCRAFFERTGEDEGFDDGGWEICAGSIHARGSNVTYLGWDSRRGKFAEVKREKIKGSPIIALQTFPFGKARRIFVQAAQASAFLRLCYHFPSSASQKKKPNTYTGLSSSSAARRQTRE